MKYDQTFSLFMTFLRSEYPILNDCTYDVRYLDGRVWSTHWGVRFKEWNEITVTFYTLGGCRILNHYIKKHTSHIGTCSDVFNNNFNVYKHKNVVFLINPDYEYSTHFGSYGKLKSPLWKFKKNLTTTV